MTTGLPSLDGVLKGVMPGDNIVWQIESVEDYRALVVPYAEAARRQQQRLIYFRFGKHAQLLPDDFGAEIHRPDPRPGFESFVTEVHNVISDVGMGGVYLFDCLSELSGHWSSDQMLGNFFMLTCPRLLELKTVTYFALTRHYHASFGIRPIMDTTQYFLDIFRCRGQLYIRPIKVQYRSSSVMNLIHEWRGDEFVPITSSAIIAEVLNASKWPGLRMDNRMGFWRRTFNEAQSIRTRIRDGTAPPGEAEKLFAQLCRMLITADADMMGLVGRYLTIDDLLTIWDRMVGVGRIGGKALGMLLARAILTQRNPRFGSLLEAHDSFFIGSEVFYTFLVRNKVWWIRQKQRDPVTFLDGLEEAQARIMNGDFPAYTLDQCREMLDYFGESPFIVRSSSLLEDNYGNAFAGKYESVFCVNQGTREKRLEDLLNAIRVIYASTMSEPALRYREQRGLLDRDEQMSLLVMRVSGAVYGHTFYPQLAGVGFSFNPYVWNEQIDPHAGMIRLVFGLGTRAVDRTDDDYTRLIAINAPLLRPEANLDRVHHYSQRRVDYLDLKENKLTSGYFVDLVAGSPDVPVDMFASREAAEDRPPVPVLTFERLLAETPFVKDIGDAMRILEAAYRHPVDIEFAANFLEHGDYKINLLQCRPLQIKGSEFIRLPSVTIPPDDRIFAVRGAVIGHSRILDLQRLIYIVPKKYGHMQIHHRHAVARMIGRLNRMIPADGSMNVAIIGPGRWGTSSPELGIPVKFNEINRMSVVCEVVAMHENLIPDVSLGTHFLNELVEMDILYLALFPGQEENYLDEAVLLGMENHLADLIPEAEALQDMVRVVELPPGADRHIMLRANALGRQAECFFR